MPEKTIPNTTPGKLIAVEGLDGSGKSTQVYLLKRWLELAGYKVFFTEWNSSGDRAQGDPAKARSANFSPRPPSPSSTAPTSPTVTSGRSCRF